MTIFQAVVRTVLAGCAITSCSLDACTGIKLTAKDGAVVHGRTAEFGVNLELSVAAIPAGVAFQSQTPQGKGLAYTSKYAAVGAMTYDNPALMDGMNEKGLSIGAFYFPGYASYATITSENQAKALSALDFSNWIVTNFATVDEVKKGLASVVIAPTIIKHWGPEAPPLHYIVYDRSGRSVVIEPLDGELVVYDNPLGVVTNSPTFDWHLTNLRNYIDLSPFGPKTVSLHDVKLAPFGQGGGMVGLPGDFTPPSRFVRAAAYSALAEPSENAESAVWQAFHILNQFDIPLGLVREKSGDKTISEWTLATTVHDPINLKYYFRTYNDQTIRSVDIKQVTHGARSIQRLSLDQFKQPVIDMSAEMRKAPEGF